MAMGPIENPRQAGIEVRRARQLAGLTQAQLAARAGVSTRLISSLELGDNPGIQLDKLLRVLAALGLSLRIDARETVSSGLAGRKGIADRSGLAGQKDFAGRKSLAGRKDFAGRKGLAGPSARPEPSDQHAPRSSAAVADESLSRYRDRLIQMNKVALGIGGDGEVHGKADA